MRACFIVFSLFFISLVCLFFLKNITILTFSGDGHAKKPRGRLPSHASPQTLLSLQNIRCHWGYYFYCDKTALCKSNGHHNAPNKTPSMFPAVTNARRWPGSEAGTYITAHKLPFVFLGDRSSIFWLASC